MSDNDVKVGDCEAWLSNDGKHISVSTGWYEYGCHITTSDWEAIKTAIDKMIAEGEPNETNPIATC